MQKHACSKKRPPFKGDAATEQHFIFRVHPPPIYHQRWSGFSLEFLCVSQCPQHLSSTCPRPSTPSNLPHLPNSPLYLPWPGCEHLLRGRFHLWGIPAVEHEVHPPHDADLTERENTALQGRSARIERTPHTGAKEINKDWATTSSLCNLSLSLSLDGPPLLFEDLSRMASNGGLDLTIRSQNHKQWLVCGHPVATK